MRLMHLLPLLLFAGCGGGGGGAAALPFLPPAAPPAGGGGGGGGGGGPTLTLPADYTLHDSASVTVDATITGAATIAWVLAAGPAPGLLSDADREDPTLQIPLAGIYRLQVTATASDGRSSSATCTITANGGWTLSGDVSEDGVATAGLAVDLRWQPADGISVATPATDGEGVFSRSGLLGPADAFSLVVPAR